MRMERGPSINRTLVFALTLFACLTAASGQSAVPDISPGKYKKVIVVIGENLGYENLFHSRNDPSGCNGYSDLATYINTDLAGVALNYTSAHSSTHPSRPNYLRIFAGIDDGIAQDGCVCDLSGCVNGSGSNPCDHSCITCDDPTKRKTVTNKPTLYDELRDDGQADTSFVLWAEGLKTSKHNATAA